MKKYASLYEIKSLKQLNTKDNLKMINCPLCKETHSIAQIPFLHTILDGKVFSNRNPNGKFIEIKN